MIISCTLVSVVIRLHSIQFLLYNRLTKLLLFQGTLYSLLCCNKKTAENSITMKNFKPNQGPSQQQILIPMKSTYHARGSFFSYKSARMNNQLKPSTEFESIPPVCVKTLIDKLITAVLPTSIEHRTLILNDVPPDYQFKINESKFALVVGNIISNIISFTKEDCLHICVLGRGEIVLRLENTNLSRNRSFIVALETILYVAERFGINLKIEEFYGKGSDVSVHFLKNAA